MFKALSLQFLHGLNAAQLEKALKVSIDFMLFVGIGVEHDTPDKTTIYRLRNRLVNKGLAKELLEKLINNFLSLSVTNHNHMNQLLLKK